MNLKTIVFKKLIKVDQSLIKRHQEAYDKTGDERHIKKIKMLHQHIKEQEENIKRFR
jgi:hypothetical protein